MKKRILLSFLFVLMGMLFSNYQTVYAEEEIEYVSVEIGNDEAFAIDTDGKIYGWGHGLNVKLQDGTIVDGTYPTEITDAFDLGALETITQVSLANYYNGVLTSLGRVLTYGSNDYGQLGDGTVDENLLPTDITDNFSLSLTETIVKIEMASGHSLAITNEGRLFTWGRNTQGELGDGTQENNNLPDDVTYKFNLGPGERIVNASFGSQMIVVYTSNNRVFSAGINTDGSLGTGDFYPTGLDPIDITSNFSFGSSDPIIDVSVGDTHTALLTASGDLFTWGRNTYGELGDGSSIKKATPVNITNRFSLSPGEKIEQVDVDTFHSTALTSDGRIFTWGYDYYGVLGTGVDIYKSNYPLDITSNFNFNLNEVGTYISTGLRNISVKTSDNRYFYWGYGNGGLITNSTESEVYTPTEFFGPDYIAPIISASDESMFTSNYATWLPSATALDNQDGDITSEIEITYFLEDGITSISTASTITTVRYLLEDGDKVVVKYNVEDSYHNQAIEVVTLITPIDNTLPVLHLVGDSEVTLDIGDSYYEMDAQVADNVDGHLYAIVGGDTVDTTTAGTYTVEYTYTDAAGNVALPITRTVHIVDNEDPVISLNANETVYFEYNDLYIEYGATYFDNADGTGIANISGDTVDTSVLGTYNVIYSYTDSSGNTGSKSRTVIIGDWTSPILALVGDETLYVEYNTTFIDPGATYTDNYDSPGMAVKYGDIVDTSILGEYYIGYEYTDTNDNMGFDVYRTVIVRDTTKPVVTLAGSSSITIEAGSSYNDAGANFNDNYDGFGLASYSFDNVDSSKIGTYEIKYSYTDTSGNISDEVTRTIIVEDTTVPVIELFGPSNVEIGYNKTFTDAGARIIDNNDKFGSVVVSGDTVDTSKLGSYTIKYNYTDTSGNVALEVIKTVNVVDNEKPVVTLIGDSLVYVELGTEYIEAGATFSDNYDTTGDVVVSGDTVLANTYGTYTVTYTITDSNQNTSLEVTRTVFVRDTQAPLIEGVSNDDVIENGTRLAVTYNEGTATLNGVSYLSGQAITTPGDYELIVIDDYGNTTSVCFCIEEENILFIIIIVIVVILVLSIAAIFIIRKIKQFKENKKQEEKEMEIILDQKSINDNIDDSLIGEEKE